MTMKNTITDSYAFKVGSVGATAFVKARVFSREYPNVIVMMTPIISVDSELADTCLNGLMSGACNIFAIDFPGVGQSGCDLGAITFSNMCTSLKELIRHIREEYGDSIHLYGATGTGGILAQALCSVDDISNHVYSLSQFGVAIHGDLSILGDTSPTMIRCLMASAPIIHKVSSWIPNMRIPFKLQHYEGLHAEEERQWYIEMQVRYPKAFDMPVSLFSTLLYLFTSKDSPLKKVPTCPTLVMASTSDRYYKVGYVEEYFNSLVGSKTCQWMDDSHLAFYWNAKKINANVIAWVKRNTETPR